MIPQAKLRTKTVKSANTDLNEYMKDGKYYFSTSYTPSNIPAGVNGWLEVMTEDSGVYIKQIWYRHGTLNSNDHEIYVRTYSKTANSWSSWKRLLTEDEMYYQKGEELSFSAILNGDITSNATKVRLALNTEKSLKNISNISITSLIGNIRGVTGYMDSDSTGTTQFVTSNYTITATKQDNRHIWIEIANQTSTFSNSTNNTPTSALLNIKMTFN